MNIFKDSRDSAVIYSSREEAKLWTETGRKLKEPAVNPRIRDCGNDFHKTNLEKKSP